MLAIVVCSDSVRRASLSSLVVQFRQGVPIIVQDFNTPLDAVSSLSTAAPVDVDVVIFSLAGVADPQLGLAHLQTLPGDPRIIIEFPQNGDDPKMALDMLRLGAYVVVAEYLPRTGELWRIMRKAINNDIPHETILTTNRHAGQIVGKWGFMSMTFNPGDQNDNEYDFAIKPVCDTLRLELRRLDEIDPNPRDLRQAVQAAITDRQVLVAQVSSTTANTMYEVGYADTLNKELIVLWRRGADPIPALISGLRRVEYSTMTELAMKMFFGLGGTRNDL